jgi:hypothetical protein
MKRITSLKLLTHTLPKMQSHAADFTATLSQQVA